MSNRRENLSWTASGAFQKLLEQVPTAILGLLLRGAEIAIGQHE